jgi:predicted metal-binding membrane protein
MAIRKETNPEEVMANTTTAIGLIFTGILLLWEAGYLLITRKSASAFNLLYHQPAIKTGLISLLLSATFLMTGIYMFRQRKIKSAYETDNVVTTSLRRRKRKMQRQDAKKNNR